MIIGPRQESRLIVDELNTKVEEARAKGVEDDTTKKRANEATKAKGKLKFVNSRTLGCCEIITMQIYSYSNAFFSAGKNNEKSLKKKGKTPRKKVDSSSEEEDEYSEEDIVDEPDKENLKSQEEEFIAPAPPSATRPKRSTRTSTR